MALGSSNLSFTLELSPPGLQSLNQESQNHDNLFSEDLPEIAFPADGLLQIGHIQGSRVDPITAWLSPHVIPFTNHQFFDLQAVDGYLNHHDNAMNSTHELLKSSPRTSVPPSDSSSTPKISQIPKVGPASSRVKKSKYVVNLYTKIRCLLKFLIMMLLQVSPAPLLSAVG